MSLIDNVRKKFPIPQDGDQQKQQKPFAGSDGSNSKESENISSASAGSAGSEAEESKSIQRCNPTAAALLERRIRRMAARHDYCSGELAEALAGAAADPAGWERWVSWDETWAGTGDKSIFKTTRTAQ